MVAPLYAQLNLFADLTPEQDVIVEQLFVPVSMATGELLFAQGDPAEYLYIVIEGEVSIRFKPDDGPPLSIARIKPECVVGWSAALGSPEYTSAAICEADCTLLRISGEDLRNLCDRCPETGSYVLQRLAEVIANRLRNTHTQVLALLEQGMQPGLRKKIEAH